MINTTDRYTLPNIEAGQWCWFHDGHEHGRYLVAQYSHSDKRTPMDIHWTAGGEYFTHCRPLGEAVIRALRQE